MHAAFFVLLGVVVGAACQGSHYQSPHQAAILSDTRYLAGDGTFGAAYSQEDGVEFKEESDVEGNRRGSYSYVDPNGQRRTVVYTAGKNGFQAIGDHIPSAPPQVPSQPEYVPLPRYNSPDYQSPSPAPPTLEQYPRRDKTPDYEPQPVVYQPQTELRYQYRPQFQPQYQYRPRPQPQPQSRYHYPPELESVIPSYASSRPHHQPQLRPAPQYNAITTPAAAPRNFYPPGKLSFNRTPDGFSYMFSKS